MEKDHIVVDVRDKQGNVLENQTVEIFVHGPKGRKPRHSHKPPAVVSRVVLMKEGEMASISDDYLLLSDADTNLSSIFVTVDKAPAMGMLWLNNKSLNLHDRFPADAALPNRLMYKNIKSSFVEDVVRLNVSSEADSQISLSTGKSKTNNSSCGWISKGYAMVIFLSKSCFHRKPGIALFWSYVLRIHYE